MAAIHYFGLTLPRTYFDLRQGWYDGPCPWITRSVSPETSWRELLSFDRPLVERMAPHFELAEKALEESDADA